jgi:hypothetical protein
LTVANNQAVVLVTLEAESVLAVGASESNGTVANTESALVLVPPLFIVTILQWYIVPG